MKFIHYFSVLAMVLLGCDEPNVVPQTIQAAPTISQPIGSVSNQPEIFEENSGYYGRRVHSVHPSSYMLPALYLGARLLSPPRVYTRTTYVRINNYPSRNFYRYGRH